MCEVLGQLFSGLINAVTFCDMYYDFSNVIDVETET